jgi:hypothetical protein
MDNETIQRKLLDLLYNCRLNNNMRAALSNIIIEKLDITVNEFNFNMDYLMEKELIDSKMYTDGFMTHTYYIITAKGIDLITPESEFHNKSKTSVHQTIHGDLNMAGRDFTINNISVNIYLRALEIAIENSEDISKPDKKDLIQKITELKDNPLVVSLGTAAITEAIKQILIH